MQLKIVSDLQCLLLLFSRARGTSSEVHASPTPNLALRGNPSSPPAALGQSRAEKPLPAAGDAPVETMPGTSGARSRSCHPAPILMEDTGTGSGASGIKQIIVRPLLSSSPELFLPAAPFLPLWTHKSDHRHKVCADVGCSPGGGLLHVSAHI